GRPTWLVWSGSVSRTRPRSTSSATSAAIVDRLSPVSRVSRARETAPRVCTRLSTSDRLPRRTASRLLPRSSSTLIAAVRSWLQKLLGTERRVECGRRRVEREPPHVLECLGCADEPVHARVLPLDRDRAVVPDL